MKYVIIIFVLLVIFTILYIYDNYQKIKDILGTKVAINQKDKKKKKIEIEYYSMEELDRIMDLFRTIKNNW